MAAKKRSKKIAAAAAAALAAAAACAALLAWQPWAAAEQAAQEQEAAEQAAQESSGQEGGSGSAPGGGAGQADEGSGGSDGQEQAGQSQGYVGPNGEGVISRDDYDSDEAYIEALIAAGENEADVPKEQVWLDESQEVGYWKGILVVNFYRSCGEERAREVVALNGGLWASSTFAWGTGDETASVEAYFAEAPYRDELEELAAELEALPEVESAYASSFFDGSAEAGSQSLGGYSVSDPSASLQHCLSTSRFRQAWESCRCEGSVEVAVLDSGADLDHPDLAGNVLASYDAFNRTVLQGPEEDTCGHGTLVAGVVAAVAGNSVGVAGCSFNARLVPVRVNSSGRSVDWYSVERALDFIFSLSNKPEVVNMSFSGSAFSFLDPEQEDRIDGQMSRARDEFGMVLVAAVGNDGDGTVNYPADFTSVIGVGSVGSSRSVSHFSNRNLTVDLCAVGEDVLSTANPGFAAGEYATDTGTSLAAPQVAAAAALLAAQNPGWEPDEVESRLLATAEDLGDPGRDDEYGWGLLDAAEAVGYSSGSGGSTGYQTSREDVEQLLAEGYAYYLAITS